MMDWKDIAIEECKKGAVALKAGVNVWSRDISDGERMLLVAAADDSEFVLLDDQRAYPCIEIGGEIVEGELTDFEMATDWDDFCSLCRRGVVEYVMDSKFHLTPAGEVHANLTKGKFIARYGTWRRRADQEDAAAG